MALSTVVKHFSDGTLTIEDGTGTPISLVLSFAQADLSVDGLIAKLRETVTYETRGQLKSVRKANRVYPTISGSVMLTDFSEASSGTLLDFVSKTSGSAFASAVSTLGANADVHAGKLTWDVEGTNFGDSADHQLTFDDVELTLSIAEGQPNVINFSGTVYGAIGGDITLAEG